MLGPLVGANARATAVQARVTSAAGESVEVYHSKIGTFDTLRRTNNQLSAATNHFDQSRFGRMVSRDWTLVPTTFRFQANGSDTPTECRLVHISYEVDGGIYVGAQSEMPQITGVSPDLGTVDLEDHPVCEAPPQTS